jgi:ElaB/YqjD/DUF883 family membrane-anchored ribosome-binding protein
MLKLNKNQLLIDYNKQKMENQEGRAQKLLNDLGKKIDELTRKMVEKAKESGFDADKEIEKLKKERDKLEEEFKEFKERNNPRWQEMLDHLENAGQEIVKAAESIFKKRS